MPDRRPVESLSVEELERAVHLRRHAERTGSEPDRNFRRPTLWSYLLMALELAAVLGVAYVFASGFLALQTINRETVKALALPTLTAPPPTPLITPLFLPDSHTPPTSPGGAQPYEASLPENIHFRVTPVPITFAPVLPTPAPEQARRMSIPAINVDAPVVQGVEWEQLKKGIGQVPGSALPGEVGNGVYTAHNDIYGELFRHLDQLQPGNEVRLYTASQEFLYIVREWRIVEPTEVSVMNPTPTATITLISCYPYLVDTQRIVVFADLVTEGTGGS